MPGLDEALHRRIRAAKSLPHQRIMQTLGGALAPSAAAGHPRASIASSSPTHAPITGERFGRVLYFGRVTFALQVLRYRVARGTTAASRSR